MLNPVIEPTEAAGCVLSLHSRWRELGYESGILTEPILPFLNPSYFLKFILFLTYASKSQLGVDPTVTRFIYECEGSVNNIRYRFVVGGRTYETVGPPISEQRAYFIVSRSTRVWRVRRVELDGSLSKEEYVLKDVWLLDDTPLEHEIQNRVRERLGDDVWLLAKRYFLTITAEEVVRVDGEDDVTPLPARRHFRTRDNQTPLPRSPVNKVTVKLYRRKHVRVVFKEVCASVYELVDGGSLGRCLTDTVQGLKYLHQAGFVHRDISAGNCLYYEGRGIVADLEYCREYRSSSVHPKTGTPDFMATEYQLGKWFFTPLKSSKIPRSDDILYTRHLWFSVHYFHDLESVFWIYLWFIHFMVPSAHELNLDTLQWSRDRYFHHPISGSQYRSSLIMNEDGPDELEQDLSSIYTHQSHTPLLKPISLCKEISSAYKQLQRTEPEKLKGPDNVDFWRFKKESFAPGLYQTLTDSFQSLSGAYPELPMERVRLGEGQSAENSCDSRTGSSSR
ncbi:hypothetical protein BDP27DRAFT_1415727 [Rhodocollybia butyracea]|uniref:Protein kinase domain-containing protein n=1 Tax=Rhodocollybia butyracea TaxID=206335 RepID=A0A9P5Q4A9_9AGAR|nr:hypothetical protein BDP27DRAFT_1415727 [Rhodocollybia butyracea]